MQGNYNSSTGISQSAANYITYYKSNSCQNYRYPYQEGSEYYDEYVENIGGG